VLVDDLLDDALAVLVDADVALVDAARGTRLLDRREVLLGRVLVR
jgi:hypothetical protein